MAFFHSIQSNMIDAVFLFQWLSYTWPYYLLTIIYLGIVIKVPIKISLYNKVVNLFVSWYYGAVLKSNFRRKLLNAWVDCCSKLLARRRPVFVHFCVEMSLVSSLSESFRAQMTRHLSIASRHYGNFGWPQLLRFTLRLL